MEKVEGIERKFIPCLFSLQRFYGTCFLIGAEKKAVITLPLILK